jgi:hypothetical protein
VARAARRTGDPFTVVFDGAPAPALAPSSGQVQVVFSRPPETADDVILRLAERHREGAIVVTSDRAVQDAARRAGATCLDSDQFAAALDTPDPEPGAPPDDADVEPLAGRPASKRGNPRRPSKEERARVRALRRLRGH